MATSGPNSGGTFTSEDYLGVGDYTWVSPSGANASDDAYANVALNNLDDVTEGLRAVGFGFALGSGDTINGIVVEIERSESFGGAGLIDYSVRLVKGGAVGGSDLAAFIEAPTTDAYQTYGSASELWGETWSYSDINSANFGVEVLYQNSSGVAATMRVDHIRITIHYTPGASASRPPQMTLMGVGA